MSKHCPSCDDLTGRCPGAPPDEGLAKRHAEAVRLLRTARTVIENAAWAGGQSKGYYCRHCHNWRNNAKMPRTSYRDIVHTPECILSRIDAALRGEGRV